MTQAITNLEASWLPNVGIQLSWTAASDVTTGSVYEVYVLQKVLSRVPQWVQVGTCVSTAQLSKAASAVILLAPNPSYFFAWSLMQNLFGIGSTVAPNSLAFSVIHTDFSNSSSNAASISVFPPAQHKPYGAPHLQNNISVDSFGQFATNPQDSYEEIADSVGMFLGTIPGQRTVVPNYGTPDLPLTQIDAGEIETALNSEEKRALASIAISYDDEGNATFSVEIKGGESN